MDIVFKSSFIKDVKKSSNFAPSGLNEVINAIEVAVDISVVANLKKLKGHNSAYRIRLQNYRICFYLEDERIILTRFLPRKDVVPIFHLML